MSTYPQPLRWAKSMYCRCRAGSDGLACSVNHDHATVPGLIHDVSPTLDGGARSSTIVDSVTLRRSPTAAVRQGVASGSVAVTEALASFAV